jgi:hypothetical protein
MLSIEKKKTDKVDLMSPIQQFLRNQYSAQTLADHQQTLQELQTLRDTVTTSTEKSEALRDMLYR